MSNLDQFAESASDLFKHKFEDNELEQTTQGHQEDQTLNGTHLGSRVHAPKHIPSEE